MLKNCKTHFAISGNLTKVVQKVMDFFTLITGFQCHCKQARKQAKHLLMMPDVIVPGAEPGGAIQSLY